MARPNFLVIGAAKCGTSSLHRYLDQHPQVFMTANKEPHYFAFKGAVPVLKGYRRKVMPITRNAVVDTAAYLRLYEPAAGASARGESSITTLYWPGTAERVHDFDPAMKLIAVLRQPVERAYSSFNHLKRSGIEPCDTLAAALEAEPARIADSWAVLYRYRDLGLYARQLEPYLRLFPREQIMVLLHEELQRDPAAVMRQVFAFLEVDATFTPTLARRDNVSFVPKTRLQRWMNDDRGMVRRVAGPLMRSVFWDPRRRMRLYRAVAAKLYARPDPLSAAEIGRFTDIYFRDDILRLQDLLRRDLRAWLP